MPTALARAVAGLRIAEENDAASRGRESPFAHGWSGVGSGDQVSPRTRPRSPLGCTLKQSPDGAGKQPGDDSAVPANFICPISMDIMVDPVVVATGHTYDRPAIERWLAQGHRTCPVTGVRLRHTELVPNHALRSVIQDWAAERGMPLPERSDTRTGTSPGSHGETGQARVHRHTRARIESLPPAQQALPEILHGHQEIVWALCVVEGPDGATLVASAAADHTIRVWDPTARRCLSVLTGHGRPVLALAAGPDGRLWSGGYDATVRVWHLGRMTCDAALAGHTDAVRALTALGQTRMASAAYDATIRVWDVDTGSCLAVLKGHEGPVRALATLGTSGQGAGHASAGGDDPSTSTLTLLSSSYDGTVRAWDPCTGDCLAVLKGHTAAVRALACVRLPEPTSGAAAATTEDHARPPQIPASTAARDSHAAASRWVVVSASDDSTLRVWEPETWRCVAVLTGHQHNVRVLDCDGSRLYSGSWDGSVRVWDVARQHCVAVLEGHDGAVLTLAHTPWHVVSGSYGGTLRFWAKHDWHCSRVCKGHDDAVRVLVVVPGVVMSGCYDGSVGVWAAEGMPGSPGHQDNHANNHARHHHY